MIPSPEPDSAASGAERYRDGRPGNPLPATEAAPAADTGAASGCADRGEVRIRAVCPALRTPLLCHHGAVGASPSPEAARVTNCRKTVAACSIVIPPETNMTRIKHPNWNRRYPSLVSPSPATTQHPTPSHSARATNNIDEEPARRLGDVLPL